MATELDHLLGQLRCRDAGNDLPGLESAVLSRIAAEQASRVPAAGLKFQAAVVCTALLLGLAIAELKAITPLRAAVNSEVVVLSDDGGLAPSVRLGGGT
jgi:hypothetical protein